MSDAKVFKISLRRLQGWIIATSDSEELKGLYLTNPSYDTVVNQIPSAIKLLYKSQYKRDVDVHQLYADNNQEKQSTDTIEFVAKAA